MANSKKGRMSGAARKEMNRKASSDAVEGRMIGITFARVTRMVGENHIRVAIPCKTGYKEFMARIPNKFGKKGSTPLTTNSIVSIFVGEQFDPNDTIPENTHFDVTSILDDKQAYQLVKDGTIPSWMQKSPDEISSGVIKSDATAGDGYEFEYSGGKENTVTHEEKDEDIDVDDI
jgi:hypothetical protein